MDSQENAEKIIKAKLKQLELQAQIYEEKVKKILIEINNLDKENRGLLRNNENNQNNSKIEENKEKIQKLHKKIIQINKDKEEALGCDLNLMFRDDSTIRPTVDIK